MTSEHTYCHFRKEWFAELMDRNTHEAWLQKGSKTLGDRANEYVRTIVETHTG